LKMLLIWWALKCKNEDMLPSNKCKCIEKEMFPLCNQWVIE
jgi:hypothetical protein